MTAQEGKEKVFEILIDYGLFLVFFGGLSFGSVFVVDRFSDPAFSAWVFIWGGLWCLLTRNSRIRGVQYFHVSLCCLYLFRRFGSWPIRILGIMLLTILLLSQWQLGLSLAAVWGTVLLFRRANAHREST